MSSIEIGTSFYVLPVVFNLLPISLCYILMGASLTLTKSLKGILIHLKLSPDVLGYDELLVHIPE